MPKANIYIDCADPQLRYVLFDKLASSFERRKESFITLWTVDSARDMVFGADECHVIAFKQEEVKQVAP